MTEAAVDNETVLAGLAVLLQINCTNKASLIAIFGELYGNDAGIDLKIPHGVVY